mmetsp:Transcript_22129/g.66460  ORF Transcript_22129/g.66460 Transcript_22129/m.66460 type:complete len:250 (-) Transcript_22129:32-781(-)
MLTISSASSNASILQIELWASLIDFLAVGVMPARTTMMAPSTSSSFTFSRMVRTSAIPTFLLSGKKRAKTSLVSGCSRVVLRSPLLAPLTSPAPAPKPKRAPNSSRLMVHSASGTSYPRSRHICMRVRRTRHSRNVSSASRSSAGPPPSRSIVHGAKAVPSIWRESLVVRPCPTSGSFGSRAPGSSSPKVVDLVQTLQKLSGTLTSSFYPTTLMLVTLRVFTAHLSLIAILTSINPTRKLDLRRLKPWC